MEGFLYDQRKAPQVWFWSTIFFTLSECLGLRAESQKCNMASFLIWMRSDVAADWVLVKIQGSQNVISITIEKCQGICMYFGVVFWWFWDCDWASWVSMCLLASVDVEEILCSGILCLGKNFVLLQHDFIRISNNCLERLTIVHTLKNHHKNIYFNL